MEARSDPRRGLRESASGLGRSRAPPPGAGPWVPRHHPNRDPARDARPPTHAIRLRLALALRHRGILGVPPPVPSAVLRDRRWDDPVDDWMLGRLAVVPKGARS